MEHLLCDLQNYDCQLGSRVNMMNKNLRLVGYVSTQGFICGDVHIIRYSGKGDYYHVAPNSKTLCGENVHNLYVEVLNKCPIMENASCEKCLKMIGGFGASPKKKGAKK